MTRVKIDLNRKIDVLRQRVLDFVLLDKRDSDADYEKLVYSIQEIELSRDDEFEKGYLKCLADILTAKDIFDTDTKIFVDISKHQNSAALVSLLAEHNSLGHQELAEKLKLSKQGLSNLIKALSETRITDEWKVGRSKIYSLTKKGFLFLEWYDLNNKKLLLEKNSAWFEWLKDKFEPSAVVDNHVPNFAKVEPDKSFINAKCVLNRIIENENSQIIDIRGQDSTLYKDGNKLLLSMALGGER
ncbi:MAG: hypothetical protein WC366_02560 [Bacilli bacterium]|jgi:DNA-binding transcriptional ArsR family regulator